MLDLFCFTADAGRARAVEAGGAAAIVIDWERRGKHDRQVGADTLIGSDTVADLTEVRAATRAPVVCRINSVGPWTHEEIDVAIAAGADELLIPMVREPAEVEHALERAGGRTRVGILIETEEAVDAAAALGALPIARVYVGLNDLAIARRADSIFTPFLDGTVDRIREAVDAAVPFGVGGLTVPAGGDPVPTRLLLAELLRLRCDFTFLRRSFWNDVGDGDATRAVQEIRRMAELAAARDRATVTAERAELCAVLEHISHPPAVPG